MRVEELLRKARREGWSVVLRGSGHFQLDHPEARRAVIVPATPSCSRRHLNAMADMRRVLPPQPKPKRTSPRPKRKPIMPKPRPVIEIAAGEISPEERPSLRLPGGPAGYTSVWSRWF
jgi:hypothetical protein